MRRILKWVLLVVASVAATVPLTLAGVPMGDRLCELDFEIPLAGGDRPTGERVLLERIADLLHRQADAQEETSSSGGVGASGAGATGGGVRATAASIEPCAACCRPVMPATET